MICLETLDAYIVKQMLMSKSQLHPVMNPAAAGGNKIATCSMSKLDSKQIGVPVITDDDENDVG